MLMIAVLVQMCRVQDAGVRRRHAQHDRDCQDAMKFLHCLFPEFERGCKPVFSRATGNHCRQVPFPMQGKSHTSTIPGCDCISWGSSPHLSCRTKGSFWAANANLRNGSRIPIGSSNCSIPGSYTCKLPTPVAYLPNLERHNPGWHGQTIGKLPRAAATRVYEMLHSKCAGPRAGRRLCRQ